MQQYGFSVAIVIDMSWTKRPRWRPVLVQDDHRPGVDLPAGWDEYDMEPVAAAGGEIGCR